MNIFNQNNYFVEKTINYFRQSRSKLLSLKTIINSRIIYKMKTSTIIKFASFFAIISVAFGAFGAHALREKIDIRSLEVWETATRYQFYHVFALFIIAFLKMKSDAKILNTSARFFIYGILLFSGSLYLLATKTLFTIDLSWAGPFTPIGGLCFIIGWILLMIFSFKMDSDLKGINS